MKAIVLKCPRSGQYHFGKIGPDENSSLDDTSSLLHSDTLFSAIINTAAKIMDVSEVDKVVKWFKKDGQVGISSGFYCLSWKEAVDKFTFFLPKPVHYNLLVEEDADFDIKSVNKVQFISKGVWEKGILPKDWINQCVFLQEKFVLLKSELPENISTDKTTNIQVYQRHSLPKVFVHKPSQEDSFYYQTNIVLGDNKQVFDSLMIHYYFLLKNDLGEKESALLNQIITLLEYEGIGGERSVGCGQITGVEEIPFELEIDQAAEKEVVIVSLTNPAQADLKAMEYYQIISRGGRNLKKKNRLKNTTQLQRVKMATEGAMAKNEIQGQIAHIGKTKGGINFLRNGRAFCLPIHSNTIPNEK